MAASFTHPFTVAADVATAVPLVGAAVVTLWIIGLRGRSEPGPTPPGEVDRSRGVRGWTPWIAAVVAVTAWELYCLANLPREQHPTLSALIDMLDSTRVGKTVAFAAWLMIGWVLVTR